MRGIARKQPIAVYAIHYTDKTDVAKLLSYIHAHTQERVEFDATTHAILIHKPLGTIALTLNNWLIHEVREPHVFWAIDANIFVKTYDLKSSNIYCKKVIDVEYFHFEQATQSEILDLLQFLNTDARLIDNLIPTIQRENQLTITTLEGNELMYLDDYLIKGIAGEYYPVSPDNFNNIYHVVK